MTKYPVLSPLTEISAYEALWDKPQTSFRSIAGQLSDYPQHLVSNLIDCELIEKYKKELLPILKQLLNFGIRIEGDGMFPERLKDAKYGPKILYYQGNWELTYLPSVAVVGTRNPTKDGIARTQNLVKKLVNDGYVIVSGLARGIDTAAHWAAIQLNGNTIGVIGTPLTRYYPPENKELQDLIAKDFLLISQVPFSRYEKQTFRENRLFFPARNITMSALTCATIIVEAGETSGTLIQAKAALEQGRKLFILDNNFRNPGLTWPKKFEEKGGIRVKHYDDIQKQLSVTQTN